MDGCAARSGSGRREPSGLDWPGSVTLPDKWFNPALAKEPLNWLIVGVIATIWLMLFHTVMQGFSAMQGAGASNAANGTAPAPQVGGTIGTSDLSFYTDGNEALFVGAGGLPY